MRLDELIEEALVDAYGEAEQAGAFQCMIDDHVTFPFTTIMLGVAVSVTGVEANARGESLVARVRRGTSAQAVPLVGLVLPDPLPRGGEWIMAYQRWEKLGGGGSCDAEDES